MRIRTFQSESELAHDEATRLGWLDLPGVPGPVNWMVAEIERLREEIAATHDDSLKKPLKRCVCGRNATYGDFCWECSVEYAKERGVTAQPCVLPDNPT